MIHPCRARPIPRTTTGPYSANRGNRGTLRGRGFNEQSSANEFKFWVYSADFGNLSLTPGTEWLLVQLGNNVYEVSLNAGECKWVYTGVPVTVQVYAGSGSLSRGTNPIAWSP
jgi:hypothetical protein